MVVSPNEWVKIVARFRNGRTLKGITHNFFANKEVFHVFPVENPGGQSKGILMTDLKAVFFVRDLTGNPDHKERKRYAEGEQPRGHKVEITFRDGEVLVGSTLGFSTDRTGFFITPADPQSNNIKVFAISSAVDRVRRI